ncbi:penicillin-binding protein [Actinoplanes awajinensis subsp. mycoplanecinus]|uniref:Penicillin-binding protein n=1 Tax=Actinoplanes awajinensis subsp. mycoplanecinus TaxID=135947 RepID=A0A101JDT0_9ACTN|nr:penicillin-binding transpeptidase domain-containing protein [Actinoplanes awajinensis]KUL24905.1 penicillin-binding protein [Actinoplanes awajinensis subsp. mycoplanecinus]
MSPRADDETPRRGTPPRRGASRAVPAEGTEDAERTERRGFSSIGEARAYTPRGRTVAERGRSPRTGRNTGDPFRPALQVVEDGESTPRARQRGGRTTEPPATSRESGEAGATSREPREPREAAGRSREGAGRGRAPREAAGRTREPREAAGRERDLRDRRSVERDDERVRRTPEPSRTSSRRTGKEEPGPRRRVTGGQGRGPVRESARRPRPVPAEPPKLANSSRRLRLGTVLALSLFTMIGIRLVVLQVGTSPAEVESLVKLREKRLSTVELPAARGAILDRSGAILANSVEARYIYADPENEKLREDVAGTAAKLSPLVGVPASELAENMQRKQSFGTWLRFRYLARGVDISVANKIKAMELPGIYTHSDERRDVPGRDLAANLIGFTSSDGHGLEGLEARYDDLLHGTDGKRVFETGKGNSLNIPITGGYELNTPAKPGSSLKLTIDRWVQYQAQQILDAEAKRNNATVAGAVILDVKTGEVLAQASYPYYNAAQPLKADASDRIDVPTSVVTDPGSSHKAFVLGAALQEGLITPESTQTVAPSIVRGGVPFNDGHPQKKGTKLTMAGVLAYSSNVGTILIGEKLGKEKLYEYQQKFGLGHATGEGMPAEAEGMLLKPEDWSGSAYGSVPIGHSVSATLVQMAAGYGAIANDGVYIQPHLIKSTVSGIDDKETPVAPSETHRVLDAEVASELRTMMEAVVEDNEGTGTKAQVQGYRVAGKTGTGKMVVDGQYTSHNASSFVGMAPAENPRYVIAISMDVAKGTGGEVAAPAFAQMMSYTLSHYFVPPSTTKPPTFKIHG